MIGPVDRNIFIKTTLGSLYLKCVGQSNLRLDVCLPMNVRLIILLNSFDVYSWCRDILVFMGKTRLCRGYKTTFGASARILRAFYVSMIL